METIEITPEILAQYDAASAVPVELAGADQPPQLSLAEFIDSFGDGLLAQVRSQNPPIYDPAIEEERSSWRHHQVMLDGLKRKPFKAQADAVHAVRADLQRLSHAASPFRPHRRSAAGGSHR